MVDTKNKLSFSLERILGLNKHEPTVAEKPSLPITSQVTPSIPSINFLESYPHSRNYLYSSFTPFLTPDQFLLNFYLNPFHRNPAKSAVNTSPIGNYMHHTKFIPAQHNFFQQRNFQQRWDNCSMQFNNFFVAQNNARSESFIPNSCDLKLTNNSDFSKQWLAGKKRKLGLVSANQICQDHSFETTPEHTPEDMRSFKTPGDDVNATEDKKRISSEGDSKLESQETIRMESLITPEAIERLSRIRNLIGDYVCQLCKLKYQDAFQLAQHKCSNIIHVEHKCPECSKVFNCPANLASHRRWHKPKNLVSPLNGFSSSSPSNDSEEHLESTPKAQKRRQCDKEDTSVNELSPSTPKFKRTLNDPSHKFPAYSLAHVAL